ncbi:MAG: C39 family peptidase [Elusimicrobiales bacterium]
MNPHSVNRIISDAYDINLEVDNFKKGSIPDLLTAVNKERSSVRFEIDLPSGFDEVIISASVDIDENDKVCFSFYDSDNVFCMGDFSPFKSYSFSKRIPKASVEVDLLRFDKKINKIGAEITLLPSSLDTKRRIRLINVVMTDRGKRNEYKKFVPLKSIKLFVKPISQMIQHFNYKQDICSPTSLSMLFDYYGVEIDPVMVAQAVYDNSGAIYGNWLFNTVYASTLGFYSFIARINSFEVLYRLLSIELPVIASISYSAGELKKAPIKKTKGHLVVIKGMTSKGDIIVNDPAACDNSSVEIVYDSKEFFKAWIENKYGTSYIVADENRISKVISIIREG